MSRSIKYMTVNIHRQRSALTKYCNTQVQLFLFRTNIRRNVKYRVYIYSASVKLYKIWIMVYGVPLTYIFECALIFLSFVREKQNTNKYIRMQLE